MSSPLGCTPTLELQRPGNFHSRAHTLEQLLGLGQTLEGDIIVTVGTCQVGQGRKIQVSRVSIEPNKCSNDIGRIGGRGRELLHLKSQKSIGAGMRPQVNLGEQCCKGRNCQMQGGKDLAMLTTVQRGLLLEHGIHRCRAGGQVDKPNKLKLN